jgi:tetratricopeptide (TPR) repeat protein
MQNSNPLVLEILRQNATLKMSLFEKNEFASTLRRYSQCEVSLPEINRLCLEVVSILNKTEKKDASGTDLIKNLQKTGQLLWDQLFTRPIKERLRYVEITDLILSLDEELVNIPWELLYDGNNFLCLKFNLGRLIRTKEEVNIPQYRSAPSVPKMLILANPTNDLKSAYLEGTFIRRQLDQKRKEISIDFKSTQIDKFYVKKNLRDYDIVHFAGHCEYDADNPENTGWLLNDGKFTTSDILAMGSTVSLPALVFSNACHSAESLGFINKDYQEKNYSLASAFLFSGVRHYIGAICKIEDNISLAFSKEFYTHLISGKSVGESVRLSRLSLIKEHGLGTIPWTNYLLYGDPNFLLFKTKIKQTTPKLKINNLLFKKIKVLIFLSMLIISIGTYLYMRLPTLNPNSYVSFLKIRQLFQKGANPEVIMLCNQIIKKDPLFLEAYPMLADTYQRLGEPDEALKYYFDYALYSQKRNNKKDLASAYIGIGKIYQAQGEYPKATDFYNKAITLSRQNNDKLNEAIALRRLAVWFIDKEDYDKALELLTKSSQINQERSNLYSHRYNLACDYFDIGLVFINKDDFSSAKEFYKKSRVLFEKMKLKNELSDYFFNLGEVYLYEKEYQKALDYYLKGLKIDEVQNNMPGIVSDYDMIGELYAQMDNWNEAESFFKQAVSIGKQIKAPLELASVYHNLGLIFKKKGQKNKARENLRQAQEIYVRLDIDAYQEIKKELLSLDNPVQDIP